MNRILLLVLAAVPIAHGATLSGTVTYVDPVPKQGVPDENGQLPPLLTVDAETNGLQGAVVYLVGEFPAKDEAQERKRTGKLEPVMITQEYFRFVPKVSAVEAGRWVVLGNGDPENHNIRAVADHPRNQFNVITTHSNPYEKRFQPEENNAPVGLKCDVHAWMAGWIYVFNHTYFAVTNEKGNFSIAGIPPGEYEAHIEQPDGGLHAAGKIEVTADEDLKGEVAFSKRFLKSDEELLVEFCE